MFVFSGSNKGRGLNSGGGAHTLTAIETTDVSVVDMGPI